MHESTKRLLDYARSAPSPTGKPIKSFADLGAVLEVSSAVVSNWKRRGLSKEGALKAEALFGCSAQWLLYGEGVAVAFTPPTDTRQSPTPLGRRVFTNKVQHQIMDDLGDLLPEDGDAIIRDLHERAEKARRHREYILQLAKPQEPKPTRQGARAR